MKVAFAFFMWAVYGSVVYLLLYLLRAAGSSDRMPPLPTATLSGPSPVACCPSLDTAPNGESGPAVSGITVLRTANTVPTVITSLRGGVPGQHVFILFGDDNTDIDFTDTQLKSANGTDFTNATINDIDLLIFDGTNWREVYRGNEW